METSKRKDWPLTAEIEELDTLHIARRVARERGQAIEAEIHGRRWRVAPDGHVTPVEEKS